MIIDHLLKINCGECSGNCYSEVLNSSVHPTFFVAINAFELCLVVALLIFIVQIVKHFKEKKRGAEDD